MMRHQDMTTAEVIAALKETVGRGGSASEWIARAYVSWYRGGDHNMINLKRFDSLDSGNQRTFMQMLTLRSRPGWDDEELWEVEKHMRAVIEGDGDGEDEDED